MNSDIIHLRRPDGRDWDGILHVNHELKTKGFLLLFNPLHESITRTIQVPLYYTGLDTVAHISEQQSLSKNYQLNRNHEVRLSFTIPADSYTWFLIE